MYHLINTSIATLQSIEEFSFCIVTIITMKYLPAASVIIRLLVELIISLMFQVS